MKISTNNIGNYSIHQIQNQVQKKVSPAKTEELSSDEKKFFVERYPQKQDEVVDYHFYQKSGSMSGVKIGHMFDKKG